jgi:hypothetical protein
MSEPLSEQFAASFDATGSMQAPKNKIVATRSIFFIITSSFKLARAGV